MTVYKILLIVVLGLSCPLIVHSQGKIERHNSNTESHNSSNSGNKNPKSVNNEVKSVNQLKQIISNLESNMVLVEGGVYMMGSNDLFNSSPVHQVEIDDFYIGKYEVTNEEWHAITGKKIPSSFDHPKSPAIIFDWEDLETFISLLNKHTNKLYRLPTEAEWEWAARGGKRSLNFQYSGSNDVKDVVSNGYKPVGTMKSNELGIYDMSGNVWELCSDYWGKYSSESQINPLGTSIFDAEMHENKKYYHVVKGGDWNPIQYTPDKMYEYQPQFRDKATDDSKRIGFRLVLDLIPQGIDQEIYLSAKRGQVESIKKIVKYYQPINNSLYIKWLDRLGYYGDINAYIQLGNIYRDGKIVPKDLNKAEQYLLYAYNSGDLSTKIILGEVYNELGLYHNLSDPKKALKYFEKGAEFGNADCQNNAGLYHWFGKCTDVNYKKAVEFFLKSASQDNYYALNNIGTAYFNGLGIEKDLDKAEYWYRKAADKGHPDAKIMLKRLEKHIINIQGCNDQGPLIGCTLKHYRDEKAILIQISDLDGQFELRDLRQGDVLRFEYIGCKSKEIKLHCSEVPINMIFYLSPGNHKNTEYETKY